MLLDVYPRSFACVALSTSPVSHIYSAVINSPSLPSLLEILCEVLPSTQIFSFIKGILLFVIAQLSD